MIVRAPCIERDTPLWFWAEWSVGPFMLTDSCTLYIWPDIPSEHKR